MADEGRELSSTTSHLHLTRPFWWTNRPQVFCSSLQLYSLGPTGFASQDLSLKKKISVHCRYGKTCGGSERNLFHSHLDNEESDLASSSLEMSSFGMSSCFSCLPYAQSIFEGLPFSLEPVPLTLWCPPPRLTSNSWKLRNFFPKTSALGDLELQGTFGGFRLWTGVGLQNNVTIQPIQPIQPMVLVLVYLSDEHPLLATSCGNDSFGLVKVQEELRKVKIELSRKLTVAYRKPNWLALRALRTFDRGKEEEKLSRSKAQLLFIAWCTCWGPCSWKIWCSRWPKSEMVWRGLSKSGTMQSKNKMNMASCWFKSSKPTVYKFHANCVPWNHNGLTMICRARTEGAEVLPLLRWDVGMFKWVLF